MRKNEGVTISEFIYLSRYIREPWCTDDSNGKPNDRHEEGENPNPTDAKGHDPQRKGSINNL
ncbi:hypothetical protein GCM10007112_20560 [Vulcanisaeta souniana JCM 11219]|uniref:Uncharacterized protein n=1 Tax=Vulcanisaeta souniana JCM 11219 TaxID=1293586 RepID=A0A830E592_9CREN|nr:hypothetical protein GCM10007112_20560 [Vulcanisaeta souniana JCM 11219]